MYNYFKYEDFKCPCCGENKTSHDLIIMLDYARYKAKTPFIVNSGYRCEKHNEKVGGKKTSSHLKGLAVDIKCVNDSDRFRIEKSLFDVGFNRIGESNSFIHVDIDKEKNKYRKWKY